MSLISDILPQQLVIPPHILNWITLFFRTLALITIAPIIFLTILDITAYVIARTLGQPHSHRNKAVVSASDKASLPVIKISPLDDATSSSPPPPGSLPTAALPLGTTIQVTTPVHVPTDFSHHFSSPSEGNLALSGEGIFSPPASRAGSPTLERRRRRSSASRGSESETDSGHSADPSISNAPTSPGDSLIFNSPTSRNSSVRQRKHNLKFTPLAGQR